MNFTLKTCAERKRERVSEWAVDKHFYDFIFESHDFNPFRCIFFEFPQDTSCIELFHEFPSRDINSSFVMKSYKFNQCSTCRNIHIEARIKANDIENDLHNLKEFHDRLSIHIVWCSEWKEFFFILNTMTDVIVLCVYFHTTKMMNNNKKMLLLLLDVFKRL